MTRDERTFLRACRHFLVFPVRCEGSPNRFPVEVENRKVYYSSSLPQFIGGQSLKLLNLSRRHFASDGEVKWDVDHNDVETDDDNDSDGNGDDDDDGSNNYRM